MMHVEERELVIPGQIIAEGDYYAGEGVFKDGESIRAAQTGLVDKRGKKIRSISLEGQYVPKKGDKILGIVIDDYYAGWILDTKSPYEGNLSVSSLVQRRVDLNEEDISKFLSKGDVVEARIRDVDELMDIDLEVTDEERGKISGGRLVEISPYKIPRLIGKKGSMISIMQKVGKCNFSVGQNGRIMIWGKNKEKINRVAEAVFMVEREAHTSGLTDRVREFLEK